MSRAEVAATAGFLKEAGGLGLRDGGDVRIWFGQCLARELAAGDVGEAGRALDALDPDVPVDVVVAGDLPGVIGLHAVRLHARADRLGLDAGIGRGDLIARGSHGIRAGR